MSEQIVKRRPMIDLEEFEGVCASRSPRTNGTAIRLRSLPQLRREEADRYKTVFEPLNRRPSGAWRNDPDPSEAKVQGARLPLIGGDFAAIEAGLLGTAQHNGAVNQTAANEEDDYYSRDGQEPWQEAGAEGSHDADPAYEEVRSRRPLYVMAAMIVAGIAGIGASFGFKGAVSNPSEIATIRAADGPAKIHPDTVASTEVTDRDATVLGGAPQQPPVAAINNAEQPADLSAQGNLAQANEQPPAAVAGLAGGAAERSRAAAAGSGSAATSTDSLSIAGLIEPKKVKTISVRPDNTLLPNDAPPQVTSSPWCTRPRPRPAKVATPKSTARVATMPKPVTGQTVPPRLAGSSRRRTGTSTGIGTGGGRRSSRDRFLRGSARGPGNGTGSAGGSAAPHEKV